jgi:uncharacterized protein YciI
VLGKQHAAHVAQLANLGVLVLGGACGEQADSTDPVVALCVLDAPTIEKASKYVQQDPAVIAGHLRADVIPWMGPKGLCLRLPQTAAVTPDAGAATPADAQHAAATDPNAARPHAGDAKPAAPAAAAPAAAGTPEPAAAPPAGEPATAPAPAPAPADGAPATGAAKPAPPAKPPAKPAAGARKPVLPKS